TMGMTIDQHVALEEALVPHASRLRIGKRNFRLRSDITSKESTHQLATATVHHHSICFKMENKKCIVNLEYFRKMLHICPRLPNRTFDKLSFEEEILAFLRYLRHTVINKCLSGKSTGYDSLRWKDFVYQVEHKDAKKSNEIYYHRDDQMFTMIKLVSRHQNTQQFGAILPIELTNEDIINSAAYKEYYAIASGAAPTKTKASVRKTQSSFDTKITPPTATGTRLLTSAKGKQPAKSSKAKGLSVLSEDDDDQDDNDDDQDTDNDGDDFIHPKLSIHEEEAKDKESFDPIVQTPKNSDDEGNDDVSL
nr:hypothetical protein [Tanacetum cinerariifolium]